jgi:predicted nucleotidyltransferase
MNSSRSLDYNLLRQFAKDNGIDFLAIYGSFFNGEATENSDIDLIIDSKKKIEYKDIENFHEQIEKLMNRKVDIITPKLMISSLTCGYVWRLKEYEIIYGEPVVAEY